MKAASAIVGVILTAAFTAGAVAAEQGNVYRWVDKDGTPHYQDRPPEGLDPGAATALSLRYRMTDQAAMAATAKQKAELDDVAKLREQQQAADKSAGDTEREQVAREREQGCETARAKAEKYETAHRLYRPGPDGQRTYLTDEEIDAARVEARRAVAEWCGE
ncbi:MAG: DUF4124 domain-containing protein [Gammaproteobacteria bacterium]|nr:DUF4124 domain-containing protein [Gammaproteobacteria bacterium]